VRCCNQYNVIYRFSIVRDYSAETNDIRDTMKIIRKLGVGKGGLKPGVILFTNQLLEQLLEPLFIPPIVMSIYEYINEKEIHLDLLSEYYKSNKWYCNRCGKTHELD
jgi:hypothetical protein